MGQFLEEIPEYLIDWILKQQMFWVASAPLSPDGHVNISPKAIEGTFHVTNSRRVWYEDLSGSGAETVAHIRENGRVTILFHAFEGPARIVRLYGKGFFYELGTPEYEALVNSESRLPGSRAVIGIDITKVGTTCGYAVPYYQFVSHRKQLLDWAEKKECVDQDDSLVPSDSLTRTTDEPPEYSNEVNPKGMKHWWQSHNKYSLDGLPAFSNNFGLGFPYVFSFGRLRASKASVNALAKKGSAVLRRNILIAPAQGDVASIPTDAKILLQFYYGATGFLPLVLMLFVGVVLGRVYEQYRHTYTALNIAT